uniref:Anti-FecI sigma factor, FecR n=1 Tax=Sphingobacterium sp. (strain 21) TaxID=743722 RepID=F4CBH0_SPHS2
MDNRDHINELFERYLRNQCTAEEINRLLDYFKVQADRDLLIWLVRAEMGKQDPAVPTFEEPAKEIFLQGVDRRLKETIATRNIKGKRIRKLIKYSLGAAASIALMGLLGVLFWPNKDLGVVADNQYGYKNDVLPGNEQAVLRMEDGKELVLGNETKMKDSQQDTKEGFLQIQDDKGAKGNRNRILTTPKGGMYKVMLGDGSKVWLNALSTLEYPANFSGKERWVRLKGEAFFDISASADRPFKIVVDDRIVEVLGTSFNVKFYDDQLTTTLVKGKIKLVFGTKQVLLKPGQEAYIDREKEMSLKQVALQDGVPWVRGDFYFESLPITEVMKDIERWYNIDVNYIGQVPAKKFTGSVSRNARLAEVLEMLKMVSGARFEIDNRKLYVDFGLK